MITTSYNPTIYHTTILFLQIPFKVFDKNKVAMCVSGDKEKFDVSYSYSFDKVSYSDFKKFEDFTVVYPNIGIDALINIPSVYIAIQIKPNYKDSQYELHYVNPKDKYHLDICSLTYNDVNICLHNPCVVKWYTEPECVLQPEWNINDNQQITVKRWVDQVNALARMVGHKVIYFKTEPIGTHHTLRNNYRRNVCNVKKIWIMFEGSMTNSIDKMTYSEWDIPLADEFTINIPWQIFRDAFGDDAIPNEKDYLYLPLVNRLFRVGYVQPVNRVMGKVAWFEASLLKYEEDSSVVMSKDLKQDLSDIVVPEFGDIVDIDGTTVLDQNTITDIIDVGQPDVFGNIVGENENSTVGDPAPPSTIGGIGMPKGGFKVTNMYGIGQDVQDKQIKSDGTVDYSSKNNPNYHSLKTENNIEGGFLKIRDQVDDYMKELTDLVGDDALGIVGSEEVLYQCADGIDFVGITKNNPRKGEGPALLGEPEISDESGEYIGEEEPHQMNADEVFSDHIDKNINDIERVDKYTIPEKSKATNAFTNRLVDSTWYVSPKITERYREFYHKRLDIKTINQANMMYPINLYDCSNIGENQIALQYRLLDYSIKTREELKPECFKLKFSFSLSKRMRINHPSTIISILGSTGDRTGLPLWSLSIKGRKLTFSYDSAAEEKELDFQLPMNELLTFEIGYNLIQNTNTVPFYQFSFSVTGKNDKFSDIYTTRHKIPDIFNFIQLYGGSFLFGDLILWINKKQVFTDKCMPLLTNNPIL